MVDPKFSNIKIKKLVNKPLIFWMSLMLIGSEVTAQSELLKDKNTKVLRIDPHLAQGGKVSDFFSSIEFIPLETTKESMFGEITQLKVVSDHFIIFDFDTKAVLIFKLDGKFVNKIQIGKKENPEFEIWGFKIRTNDNQEVIEISTGKNAMLFDLMGKLIKKTTILAKYKYEQHILPDSTVVEINYSPHPEDSIFYEVALTKSGVVKEKYFPYQIDDRKSDVLIRNGFPIYNTDNYEELYLVRYYDYNVYRISKDGLMLAYQIVFPGRNSLPIDFMTNPDFKKSRLRFFESNKDVYYGISNVYRCGSSLFLNVNNRQHSSDSIKELIYNLNNDNMTSVRDLLPDSTSAYLPITDAGLGDEFQKNGFKAYVNGYLYTSYSAATLLKFRNQNIEKNISYGTLLNRFLLKGNKESNPVIIKLRPKKH